MIDEYDYAAVPMPSLLGRARNIITFNDNLLTQVAYLKTDRVWSCPKKLCTKSDRIHSSITYIYELFQLMVKETVSFTVSTAACTLPVGTAVA